MNTQHVCMWACVHVSKCVYTCHVPRMHAWTCVCVGAISWQEIMSWQRWYSCSEHGLCHPLVPAVGTHDYVVAASGLTRERWQGCGHKCHIPGAGGQGLSKASCL